MVDYEIDVYFLFFIEVCFFCRLISKGLGIEENSGSVDGESSWLDLILLREVK